MLRWYYSLDPLRQEELKWLISLRLPLATPCGRKHANEGVREPEWMNSSTSQLLLSGGGRICVGPTTVSNHVTTNALSELQSGDCQVPASSVEGQSGSFCPLSTQVLVRHPGRNQVTQTERWWTQRLYWAVGGSQWKGRLEREWEGDLSLKPSHIWLGPSPKLHCLKLATFICCLWRLVASLFATQLLVSLILNCLCCSASWSILWA